MNRLNPIDAAFALMESARTPMHVGGLMIFRAPQGRKDFVEHLFSAMRQPCALAPPFNARLAVPHRWNLPRWEENVDVDLAHHVRRVCMARPGGARELDALISRLHSQPMDLTRPLWECHLIEGLPRGRFAVYLKVHHCAVDGIAALRLIAAWLTKDPAHDNAPGPWAMPVAAATAGRSRSPRSWLGATWRQLRSAAELGRTLMHLLRPRENPAGGLLSALHTPATPFNEPVTPERAFATQSFELPRLKRLAVRTNATINDLALALCSGALRRYLEERDGLPDASLVASVPVGLARRDGQPGNAVAGFVCPLATDEPDPLKRLRTIQTVTARTKQQLGALSPAALGQFSLLGFSPLVLGQLSGLGGHVPALFNVVVSNVVGPRERLYLRGARLESLCPVSVLFDGYALNASLVSYDGRVTFGFTACPETVPDLHCLAEGTRAALDELERASAAAHRHVMPAHAGIQTGSPLTRG